MAEPLPTTQFRSADGDSFCLVRSHEPDVVFGSLAAESRARFCDVVVVDLDDDGVRYLLREPADDGPAFGMPKLRYQLRVPFPAAIDPDPSVPAGVVVFGWAQSRPTEAVEMLARTLTVQAVSIVAWQRSEQRARESAAKVGNLEIALASSRQIGAAVGIVMSQHKVTSDDAFALLRRASQDHHRKVHDLALDVIDTGWLDPRFG